MEEQPQEIFGERKTIPVERRMSKFERGLLKHWLIGLATTQTIPSLDTRLTPDVGQKSDVPKIKVQAPSQASDTTDDDPRVDSEPRGIDSVLANDERKPPEKVLEPESDTAEGCPQPIENQNEGDPNPPQTQKLKKRKTFVRKTRNLIARKVFLKMALGRQLAIPVSHLLAKFLLSKSFSLSCKICERSHSSFLLELYPWTRQIRSKSGNSEH